MPELLLEVGCEELPAVFVRKAYTDLLARLATALGELYDTSFEGSACGTPRRLIVAIHDLPARQPDSVKEVRGPALKAAYDADGNPTGALQGFCRSNGVTPADLRKDETYVWLTKTVTGLPTSELLAETLPKVIRGLTFEKSMRWGSSRMRFARPIRWLLAAFDGAAVEFEIEGVKSGIESRGHRFYGPECFTARSYAELMKGLRDRKVEPDVELRAESIRLQAMAAAGGQPDLPEDLVEENAFLTEWPTAIAGEFRAEHLSLPAPVLVTAMAKHERMFPVRTPSGELTNLFVFIRNSGEDDSTRRGAEWVLNARLDDAQFFYKEDAKHDLDYFLEKTAGIVFQEKLGTVRDRADRLEKLAGFIALQTGGSKQEIALARQAGRYAKADLSTGLVGDMASLQGIVGGEYARRQGFPESVCWAISSQYDHRLNPSPETEGSRTALRLCLADNLDKLVGYLGLGLVPTGSSDPYGLRRAATALIEIALSWPQAGLNHKQLASEASEVYGGATKLPQVDNLESVLMEIFAGRYSSAFAGARYDVLEAATHREDEGVLVPSLVATRVGALQVLADDTAFIQAATRPLNILSAAEKKGTKFARHAAIADHPENSASFSERCEVFVKPSELDSAEGVALGQVTHEVSQGVAEAIRLGSSADLAAAAKRLEKPINAFFDATMVMADDEQVRFARLTLLQRVAVTLRAIGDFTKVVIEG